MAVEWWKADGLLLTEGLVREVEYRDGLYASPAAPGDDPKPAGAHGTLWRAKTYDPGGFVLRMWLGGSTRAETEALWDQLLRIFGARHRLIRFERGLADGTARECHGEVVERIPPEAVGQLGIRAAIEVSVPAAFWRDHSLDPVLEQGTVAGAALPQRLELTAFAKATAPMTDLRFVVHGPVTAPVVTQEDTGQFFQYLGTVGAGQTLVVDAGTWDVSGTGGLNPPDDAMHFNGYRYMEVPARSEILTPAGPPTVRLSGSAGGAGTRLVVSGRRKYLA